MLAQRPDKPDRQRAESHRAESTPLDPRPSSPHGHPSWTPDIVSIPRLSPAPHDALRHLTEKISPQFNRQLSDFLRGKEYRDALSSRESAAVSAWVVEYLNSVGPRIPSPRYAHYRHRFLWELGITQALLSRNPCMNLKNFAVPTKCYRNHSRFRNRSWDAYMRGHSMARRCASGV